MQAIAFLLLAAAGGPWAIPESGNPPQRPASRVQFDDSSVVAQHRDALDRAARQQVVPAAPTRPNPYRGATGATGVRSAGYDQPSKPASRVKLAQYTDGDAWPTHGNARRRAFAAESSPTGLRRTGGQPLGPPPGGANGDPYGNAGVPPLMTLESDNTNPANASAIGSRKLNRRAGGDGLGDFPATDPFSVDRPSQVPAGTAPNSGQRSHAAVRDHVTESLQLRVTEYDKSGPSGADSQTRQQPPVNRQAQAPSIPSSKYPPQIPAKRPAVGLAAPATNRQQVLRNPRSADSGVNRATDPQSKNFVANPTSALVTGARNFADDAGHAVDAAGAAAGKLSDEYHESTRGGRSLLFLAFFASLGLNFYLGWIAWDTYNRYQDMVSDMRYSGTAGGGRRDRLDRDAERRGDRRLADSGAY